jgi:circadian clock protein KaiB
VIDIYQQPKLAAGEQIIATPTLIKKLPLPLRKLIGDMSDKERFLVCESACNNDPPISKIGIQN